MCLHVCRYVDSVGVRVCFVRVPVHVCVYAHVCVRVYICFCVRGAHKNEPLDAHDSNMYVRVLVCGTHMNQFVAPK